jgi:hypothetical protein
VSPPCARDNAASNDIGLDSVPAAVLEPAGEAKIVGCRNGGNGHPSAGGVGVGVGVGDGVGSGGGVTPAGNPAAIIPTNPCPCLVASTGGVGF